MAKVSNNIFVRGLSGSLGDQFIVKTDKNGQTIVSAKPIFNRERVFSPAQLAQQQAFREAAAYARDKKGEAIYVSKADSRNSRPYNIAVGDWFNRPEILEVDMSGWTNGSGGVIRVRAQDDVKVEGVRVTIADESGTLLEEGEAQEIGALWWEFNTAHPYAANLFVTVAARDLPGHETAQGEITGHPRMP